VPPSNVPGANSTNPPSSKQHTAFNSEPEHFHDAGDDTQRVAMRKSAGGRNHAERVGAESWIVQLRIL